MPIEIKNPKLKSPVFSNKQEKHWVWKALVKEISSCPILSRSSYETTVFCQLRLIQIWRTNTMRSLSYFGNLGEICGEAARKLRGSCGAARLQNFQAAVHVGNSARSQGDALEFAGWRDFIRSRWFLYQCACRGELYPTVASECRRSFKQYIFYRYLKLYFVQECSLQFLSSFCNIFFSVICHFIFLKIFCEFIL